MKKIISLIGVILFLVSCGSSRPKYSRCPKNKRCVDFSTLSQKNIVFVNLIEKTKNHLVFNTFVL